MTSANTHIEPRNRVAVVLTYAATLVLTLLPLFKVGFTSSDDFQYYVTSLQTWEYWQMDHYYYSLSGRFYFLITKYFYYVPYLADNFAVAKAIQYVTLTGCYLLFAHLVRRTFNSEWIGLLTLLLLILNTAITPAGYFVANINYPFYFTFSFIIFMAGALQFANYRRLGGAWRPWVGGALMLVSYLFYETYVLLAAMLGLYIVLRHMWRGGFRALWSGSLRREVLPLIVGAVAYVAVFFGFRMWLTATNPEAEIYSGTSFSASTFNLANFFKVLARCTVIALPCQPYFYAKDIVADSSLLLGGHRNSPLFILTHASAVVWVNATLQCGLLWWLTGQRHEKHLGWKTIAVGAVAAAAVAYFVHTLIGIAPKYNIDWVSWMKGYVTSLYSLFGVALFIAFAIAASLKAVSSGPWRTVLRVVWCAVLLLFSVTTGYSNEHLSRVWQNCHRRVTAINLIAHSGYLDTLREGTILYTNELHTISTTAYAITEDTRDIENLINFRAKPQLAVTYNYDRLKELHTDNPEAPIVYVHAIQDPKTGDLLIAFAPLDSLPDSNWQTVTSQRADLFYLSTTKDYTVVYNADGEWETQAVYAPHNDRLTRSTIEAQGLDPRSIVISNMTTE
ncbi:MAG: hypothetical protein K5650_01380 [Bacteroidales bacterium]|nr:hypothetical protein [Bacteroidales bacterium]